MIRTPNSNNKFALSQYLNERIGFHTFLLIDEEGNNLGIVDKERALRLAREKELDLFCITPNANPPVCRVLDFPKYIYQLKKKDSDKSLSKKSSLKEAKFSFRISDNDIAIKVRKIVKWLDDGSIVKIVLFMRGREQQHKDIALQKANKIVAEVEAFSPAFQLKDQIKLMGSMYNFTFFRNKKGVKNEKDQI